MKQLAIIFLSLLLIDQLSAQNQIEEDSSIWTTIENMHQDYSKEKKKIEPSSHFVGAAIRVGGGSFIERPWGNTVRFVWFNHVIDGGLQYMIQQNQQVSYDFGLHYTFNEYYAKDITDLDDPYDGVSGEDRNRIESFYLSSSIKTMLSEKSKWFIRTGLILNLITVGNGIVEDTQSGLGITAGFGRRFLFRNSSFLQVEFGGNYHSVIPLSKKTQNKMVSTNLGLQYYFKLR